MTAQKRKRVPVGAAIPGFVDRPKNFPHSLVVLISADMQKALDATAAENDASKSDVVREWLELGRSAGGKFPDES